ncbi:DUF4012 domain-containing protein [Pseudarthrobacter chlorophenolicus]|uniref:DUF4012 domain-containing protein n=1 Tax=Pseudarthrobacter chlorophenolicus TaxID=85085 RepID=UPI001F3DE9CC|nr:DUF4012 domain-containing protein [Pseudarthrobacter chlorophenolicus]
MNGDTSPNPESFGSRLGRDRNTGSIRTNKLVKIGLPIFVLMLLSAVTLGWLGVKAASIKAELESATALIPVLKEEIRASDADAAKVTAAKLREHTSAARVAADDPIWMLSIGLPILGPNLGAVSEMARSADDVAGLGISPLVNVYGSLDWDTLMPNGSGTDLRPLTTAAPTVASAAHTVRASSERLQDIDATMLLPQVADPLRQAVQQLNEASGALASAADVATVAPGMLGAESAKSYLLMIQNNAEARASGGIPGALAVLTLDNGRLSLGSQSSATGLGSVSPPISVDAEQQHIYSTRLGKYMQDVNLTPDFPTAAATAQAIWEKKTGQKVDGVLSIDPIVLSYILQSTGPIAITGDELDVAKAAGLPVKLDGNNVVPTLLSDVYKKIEAPELQDAYFAGVAREVFSVLSGAHGEAQGLISGLVRGTEEGRVLIWSSHESEQSVIANYPLGGAISGPSVSPAQFAVYFNDGTGAKMDYYVKRTVQLIKKCPVDGYEQTVVRVTSTNTAPLDAATSLPSYVTGAGMFGVPPGTVQTNIVSYGPAQANVESVTIEGQKTPFAPHRHASRPVGTIAQQLAPGETKTVDFTFGKIVQHNEPRLIVTPTVQAVKDVILTTENAGCPEAE